MTQLTIDLDDEDTFVTLTLALEDYIAGLRDDLHDRLELFDDNSFTVKRVLQRIAAANELLAKVVQA